MTSNAQCDLAGRCSGCLWIDRPFEDQLREKEATLRSAWQKEGLADLSDLKVHEIDRAGLRERVDLIHREEKGELRLGLYDTERREILSLDRCPQMSPAMQNWFDGYRRDLPAVKVGSVRLRVAPDGTRGAWLDFANLDIKRLLDEGTWLERLTSRAVVEIGQKRKRLVRKETGWGLGDAVLAPWSQTYVAGRAVPLYSSIGTFTQVGAQANRALIEAFLELLPKPVEGRWLELGAGIGNFTIPLASAGAEIDAVEIDAQAVEGLARAAGENRLSERIHPYPLSFQHASEKLQALLQSATGIVADPPRSGLLAFPEVLGKISTAQRPKHFIYVSCFAESFSRDAAKLTALGYRLVHLVGQDQFPQTPHCEYLASFERS